MFDFNSAQEKAKFKAKTVNRQQVHVLTDLQLVADSGYKRLSKQKKKKKI